MSARENILNAITANKPTLVSLPVIDLQQVTNYDDLLEKFTATLQGIGGQVIELADINQLQLLINEETATGHTILNAINGVNDDLNNGQDAITLEPVYKAFIKASIGVAENGAVWINESQMINRLLPFICQHLVVVLEKEKIVSTMHHAYQKINVFEEGFGVFIAGPSKTADIEQSLVIGAHGARSMTVYILN
jgi:L-lactate dehydrogenase complex protein LldG